MNRRTEGEPVSLEAYRKERNRPLNRFIRSLGYNPRERLMTVAAILGVTLALPAAVDNLVVIPLTEQVRQPILAKCMPSESAIQYSRGVLIANDINNEPYFTGNMAVRPLSDDLKKDLGEVNPQLGQAFKTLDQEIECRRSADAALYAHYQKRMLIDGILMVSGVVLPLTAIPLRGGRSILEFLSDKVSGISRKIPLPSKQKEG